MVADNLKRVIRCLFDGFRGLFTGAATKNSQAYEQKHNNYIMVYYFINYLHELSPLTGHITEVIITSIPNSMKLSRVSQVFYFVRYPKPGVGI